MVSGSKIYALPVSQRAISPEETYDFLSQFILGTEAVLTNPIIGKTYTEEDGTYAGLSRIIVKGFRIYFEQQENEVWIVAVLFPGRNENNCSDCMTGERTVRYVPAK